MVHGLSRWRRTLVQRLLAFCQSSDATGNAPVALHLIGEGLVCKRFQFERPERVKFGPAMSRPRALSDGGASCP